MDVDAGVDTGSRTLVGTTLTCVLLPTTDVTVIIIRCVLLLTGAIVAVVEPVNALPVDTAAFVELAVVAVAGDPASLPELTVPGEEEEDPNEESVTEGETLSDVSTIDVEGVEDGVNEAEESGLDVGDISEAAAELKGVEVGEGCAALLVGPVPMGTF